MRCCPNSKNNCWLKLEPVIRPLTIIPSYMQHQKLGPRAEYRRQEGERVKNSPTLAQTFSQLKSLTVNLAYSSPENLTPSNHLKYTVNPASAKSLFRFDCPNQE